MIVQHAAAQQASRACRVSCLPRSGTDFATIWGTFCDAIFCAFLSHSCAFCAHFMRILCIFGAIGQMQWMHRPADRASRPGVAKYRNAAFVVHFTCIYVHLRTRMQNACRMHVNVHKMALAKLQVHSPDAILPRSSPDHPSPASECHPDRHRGRWLRMHMIALRMHRRECASAAKLLGLAQSFVSEPSTRNETRKFLESMPLSFLRAGPPKFRRNSIEKKIAKLCPGPSRCVCEL